MACMRTRPYVYTEALAHINIYLNSIQFAPNKNTGHPNQVLLLMENLTTQYFYHHRCKILHICSINHGFITDNVSRMRL
jgi:hypothetical protein